MEVCARPRAVVAAKRVVTVKQILFFMRKFKVAMCAKQNLRKRLSSEGII